MWAFIVSVVPLILLIFQEFFSAQARAREANRKFELDQETMKKLVDSAVQKWNDKNAKDSAGAGNAWDKADGDNNK